jgi:hypothetical protein
MTEKVSFTFTPTWVSYSFGLPYYDDPDWLDCWLIDHNQGIYILYLMQRQRKFYRGVLHETDEITLGLLR